MEQLYDEQTGLELNHNNVETVLNEIRPYLIGTGGGGLELVDIDGPIVKVRREQHGASGLHPGQSGNKAQGVQSHRLGGCAVPKWLPLQPNCASMSATDDSGRARLLAALYCL